MNTPNYELGQKISRDVCTCGQKQLETEGFKLNADGLERREHSKIVGLPLPFVMAIYELKMDVGFLACAPEENPGAGQRKMSVNMAPSAMSDKRKDFFKRFKRDGEYHHKRRRVPMHIVWSPGQEAIDGSQKKYTDDAKNMDAKTETVGRVEA